MLAPNSARRASELQVDGPDVVLERRARRSLGSALPNPEDGDIGGDSTFGHPGMGGSIGYADSARRLGFGYVMNQMGDPLRQVLPDPRWHRIVAPLQEILPER